MVEVEEAKLSGLRSLILDSLALAYVYRSEVDQYLSNGFFKNFYQRFISTAVTKIASNLLLLGIIGGIVSLFAISDRGLTFCVGISTGALIILAVVAMLSIVSTAVKAKEGHKIRRYCNYFYEEGWKHLSILDDELGITRESSQIELTRRIDEETRF